MRYSIAAIMILLIVGSASAQIKDCGAGIPCGVVPWTFPELPRLNSPTPAPTIAATATPSAPAPTATSVFTGTPAMDGVEGGLTTLEDLLTSTPQALNDFDGTPVGAIDYEQMIDDGALFVGYSKAILSADFGFLTIPLRYVTAMMLFMLTVKIAEMTIPLVALIFGALRKIISTIFEMLPF